MTEAAQMITIDLQTFAIIVGGLVSGAFTLSFVCVSVYISSVIKITKLEEKHKDMKEDINALGCIIRKTEKHGKN